MNYYNKDWGRWFVLGLAMRGDESNCATNCNPNVFTRVKAHLPFICRITNVLPPDGKCY
jgi:hypothetical protein